jgi:ribosomal protein S6--L-glutamate ligase
MILSFHPLYTAGQNMLCAGRDPGQAERTAIQQARAVILPQGCRESLYRMARNNCSHIFPDYHARFAYPEKIGQTRLFQKMGVHHPQTVTYEKGLLTQSKYDDLLKTPPFKLPFVFKFNWGGGGDTVFLIRTPNEFEHCLQKARLYEKSGQSGFLIQKFVPSGGRSLRVVVIHQTYFAYWRTQAGANAFYTNLARGAKVDADSDPHLQHAAMAAVKTFCQQTRINLAGFDFLFSETDIGRQKVKPLFLEINYFFGRKGLGGSDKYYRMLVHAIDDWCNKIPRAN